MNLRVLLKPPFLTEKPGRACYQDHLSYIFHIGCLLNLDFSNLNTFILTMVISQLGYCNVLHMGQLIKITQKLICGSPSVDQGKLL